MITNLNQIQKFYLESNIKYEFQIIRDLLNDWLVIQLDTCNTFDQINEITKIAKSNLELKSKILNYLTKAVRKHYKKETYSQL